MDLAQIIMLDAGTEMNLGATHPADETRIRQIRGWMPEAMRYYKSGR